MTPDSFPHFSLAFFSGEWVRRKNVLSILMQCFMIFQAMFVIISSALIIGAYAEMGM
jgi:ammonia channel protein AmtB